MSYPILALEGISYAGKTSLSLKLESRGFLRVSELSEFQNNGGNFPKFPRSNREALLSDKWFLEQEILRSQCALRLAEKGIVIMDRSWLSSSAFTYARSKIYGLGDYDFHTSMIHNAIEQGELISPVYVYLNIDLDTYTNRRRSNLPERIIKFGENIVRHVSVPDRHLEFTKAQIEFYDDYFLNKNKKEINGDLILDGARGLEYLTWQVTNFVDLKNYNKRQGDVYAN